MAGTIIPLARTSKDADGERRTISGERRVALPHSDTFPVAAEARRSNVRDLLVGADIDGFIEGALNDSGSDTREETSGEGEVIPISEGTVQLPRFESSRLMLRLADNSDATSTSLTTLRMPAVANVEVDAAPLAEPAPARGTTPVRPDVAAAAALSVLFLAAFSMLAGAVRLVLFP